MAYKHIYRLVYKVFLIHWHLMSCCQTIFNPAHVDNSLRFLSAYGGASAILPRMIRDDSGQQTDLVISSEVFMQSTPQSSVRNDHCSFFIARDDRSSIPDNRPIQSIQLARSKFCNDHISFQLLFVEDSLISG